MWAAHIWNAETWQSRKVHVKMDDVASPKRSRHVPTTQPNSGKFWDPVKESDPSSVLAGDGGPQL